MDMQIATGGLDTIMPHHLLDLEDEEGSDPTNTRSG
jgi:hypothetical protein